MTSAAVPATVGLDRMNDADLLAMANGAHEK
jgi:hypothetical protein